jgi:pyruvate dehydrogenase E1 component
MSAVPINPDEDVQETREWEESIEAVIKAVGPERAKYLLTKTFSRAYESGAEPPNTSRTPYVNTIPLSKQLPYPGNRELEKKLNAVMRWNAMAMVVRANRDPAEPGGHIASFQSSANMYMVGFHHFWRAASEDHGGDMIYFQGHVAPGIYSRAFLEGRLTEDQIKNFRREVDGEGISSYPHPWLMPDFWQFPTVSMGIGPIAAIYQARFTKYLHNRGLIDAKDRMVWAFLGDGEMDEPESRGAISLAVREKLDNLVFVVNCNLQRLDGPVRGNGKIIQELEGDFRGAGWNVVKIIWGSGWDDLLAKDEHGLLRQRMEECVDGDYQTMKSRDGAYVREHFFGKYPETLKMVEHMSDDEIFNNLMRGGHDVDKLYSAYQNAMDSDLPTLLLPKTVKGFGMGDLGEGMNISHQQKKMGADAMRRFADRFNLPVTDEQVENADFIVPDPDSEEMKYLHDQRKALGGYLPSRRQNGDKLVIPGYKDLFKGLLDATGERTMSTTMAAVRIMVSIARDKTLGPRLVPIVPDEARTFGMEGMFRQIGIYNPLGQTYTAQDAGTIMPYKEDEKGQLLQEGINEAGAVSSWMAAATAYSTHGVTMIPMYIFYSMFGFQRIGDFAWAASDSRARGFLIGGTSGRTTLNGEGLQHQDGHSQLFASFIPNCIAYDPTFHYEMAVIFQDGMRRMYQEQESVWYYITTLNENYSHPAMPEDSEEGIIKGMYRLTEGAGDGPKVNLLGCGSILRESMAAAEMLANDHGVSADVWSVTSLNELSRDGQDVERYNGLHPTAKDKKVTWVEQCLGAKAAPTVASTDYMKMFSEQIRPFVNGVYLTLGTDGFGRSDSRAALRHHFEVDRNYITITALNALVEAGVKKPKDVADAIKKYGIDPEKLNPLHA